MGVVIGWLAILAGGLVVTLQLTLVVGGVGEKLLGNVEVAGAQKLLDDIRIVVKGRRVDDEAAIHVALIWPFSSAFATVT